MTPLNDAFRAEIGEMLGAEAPAFFAALEEAPALALRLNPARPGALESAAEWFDARVPWEPNGYYLRPGARPGASVAHAAGAFYLQEASAMVSAAALDAQPGERVLDLCAAPGGKSGQIAAALRGEGVLIANEPEFARAKALASNLERLGAQNAVVVCALPDALAARWAGFFDAVLCDAPCSGEGMFRREPASRAEWRPASPAGCARRQAAILDSAAALLRPGGRLIYSTCTFNRTENEETVAAFLARHPEFSPEDFALPGLGASAGGMLRVWPQRARGDGHFAARLRKAGATVETAGKPGALEFGTASGASTPRPGRNRRGGASASERTPDAGTRALLRAFDAEICALPEALVRRAARLGDRIFAVPDGCPSLDGLRIVSPGLMLARVGKNHVEPEHALAMALGADGARRSMELDDAEAARYLSGEALPCPEALRGWTLARWRGLPLGWGKASGGQLKNHLPKGLRRM